MNKNGQIDDLNWKDNYIKLRQFMNATYPNGFMINEAVQW